MQDRDAQERGPHSGNQARHSHPGAVPSDSRMLTNYLADIEQLLCEQRWDAALREARFMSPQCATRSISMLPGGGSFQSAKVRTATRRRISGVTRRGFLVRVALRGARSNRSIVAALIVSTLVRMGFFPQHDQRLLRSLVVDRTVEDSNGDISREAT